MLMFVAAKAEVRLALVKDNAARTDAFVADNAANFFICWNDKWNW
jgi:hypothetical protein